MSGKRSLFLWIGVALLAILGTNRVRADEKGDALLKEVEQAAQATQTLTADMSLSETVKKSDGKDHVKMAATIKLKKPNLARIEFTGGYAKVRTIASDGKNVYRLMPNNQYQKSAVDPQGKAIDALWAVPVNMFFGGEATWFFGGGSKPETSYMGKQTVDGVEYEVVQLKGKGQVAYTMNLFIAPSKLATRMDVDFTLGAQTFKMDAILKNVKTNVVLSDTTFAYTPPKSAKSFEQLTLDDYNKKMLPVGSVAPQFALSAPTGGRTTLADALKGKKAVLVNFWFYN